MGSIIASHFCEKYPNDINKKLILLSPIFRGEAGQVISDIEYGALTGVLHLLPKNPRYKVMKSKPISFIISHVLTYDKTKQKEIDNLHYKYSGRFASADSLLGDVKISMCEQTIIPKNKEILFCIGEKDQLTPVKLVNRKAKESHNQIKIVANTGHLINYERPQAVAEIVDEFIR